ncbi:adenosylmethionine-8-amino-7-oxononanoate aminotransferase [Haloferula luteola]|uniref:Adenosylmethionine-8-amino-7-oxononanoate aminotransferase n=1 Tax=Haloferula luteola TaxID=595692 RepID=A0A840V779_9BACT|nr:adenosylmethionine--8-amino-7-oxononanoate transaminase [Haloferula luteola]MBB5352896.1 adenosylmethionine-8-amino-7-oxononanoate aminotransferase [Haloferula luteola]
MRDDTRRWIEADKRHAWHPFTPQDEWTHADHDPLILVRGEGPWLWDSEGRRYLDGNASIWTNIHGHAHPVINAAIRTQLEQVAHTSYLGFGNPRASELAEKLTSFFPEQTLERVFFSDDGSTAMECAMKMSLQFRMQTGAEDRRAFVAFAEGYHGDTLGAASLGGVSRFFERFRGMGPEVRFVRSLDELRAMPAEEVHAVVIEPLIQGVNEMRPWPAGMLRELRSWSERAGVLLILDEVMTGFGRTGTMFACQQEAVIPDFLCVAKGLTGGYLPLAATLTTRRIYEAFGGAADQAFYYGHSFTANPLGCAAALASLSLFESEGTLESLPEKIAHLSWRLDELRRDCPEVVDVRQCGMVAGIELKAGLGAQTCVLAREFGLLTRPIRDTVVLMPPLCVEKDHLDMAVEAIRRAARKAQASVSGGCE